MKNLFKVVLGLGISGLAWAEPTTKVLLTMPDENKVIELGTTTEDPSWHIVWEYGDGGTETLQSPQEAIPLTNGNILIADYENQRIVEVTPDKAVKNTFNKISGSQYGDTFTPVDVRRCTNWVDGPYKGSPTVLFCDWNNQRVIEATYPDGNVVWEYQPGMLLPREAEKKPGAGTPTYLIVDQYQYRVIEVERTGQTSGDIKWSYSVSAQDANWTPCGNVLITLSDKVIEVDRSKDIVIGTITPTGLLTGCKEAIRMQDGNVLVAGYFSPSTARVVEYQGSQTNWNCVWKYDTSPAEVGFVDVELKGIINVAKIRYENINHANTQTTLCGVIIPILQPIIENPFIEASKTATPMGPVSPGATITYTIYYTNKGAGTATNVTIIDQIPEGTEYMQYQCGSEPYVDAEFSHDGGRTFNSDQTVTADITHIKWTIDEVAPGTGGWVKFSVKVQ
ncbi:MAG: hypothetical protein AB1630_02685 [bacterium]